ncbi:MAG: TRAP transporter permease [Deltaproteobacteria bacterium]|nr:TRAP transporter permease [Deltaproteobacteria bacterium]
MARAARSLAIAMSLYHLYVALTGAPEALIFRGVHLLFALLLIFLLHPVKKGRISTWDLLPLGLSLASIGYLFLNYDYLQTRYPYVHPLTLPDQLFGLLLILLVLESTRRAIGWMLPLTALAFLAYAWAGPLLPPGLRHGGVSLELIVDQMALTTEGIFGIPLGVSATYVILFVIFGAFLERSGAGQFFVEFASSLAGWSRGGPGKISCISSGLFGTISGSAVANVMVDGWLTIPLMKKTGFQPHFACAVEATASTGGQIMPPIMGAAAFVMAEFLGIPYSAVALHALIPALLYYLALFMSIHFEAHRTGLSGLPRSELPALGQTLKTRGHLFLPVFVILYFMLAGYTPVYACLVSIFSVVVISTVRHETRMDLRQVLDALENGARNALAVAAACACAGLVIGVISLTGLGLKFTSLVLTVAGQSLILVLLLPMVTGIILGMGLPTTAAYIVQAALLIPALIKLGVLPIAAHMFVFYFAIISAITPPVAMAVYAAAGIGGANIWKTGLAAVRIGATGFVVPYMFVFGPPLLSIGQPLEIALAFATACFGVTALAMGLQGWMLQRVTVPERLLLLAAAVALIKPGWVTDLAGLALLGLAFGLQKLAARSFEAAKLPSPNLP